MVVRCNVSSEYLTVRSVVSLLKSQLKQLKVTGVKRSHIAS